MKRVRAKHAPQAAAAGMVAVAVAVIDAAMAAADNAGAVNRLD
jgi:hypothetical protein